MLKRICSRRRVNIYFKFTLLLLLAIFYITFLFRESLNAFEMNKDKSLNKPESNPKPEIIRNRRRHQVKIEVDPYADFQVRTTKIPTTLNPVYEYSEEIHSATERNLTSRKTHLNEICKKRNIVSTYPPKPWEFFVSPGHNLVWCNIFKAASSTWMYYFNILGGYDIKYLQRTKMSPLELARHRFPRPELLELFESLASSLSFLTVREPFERLLSAYRDKLEGCRNKYYKVLGKQIIRQFRKGAKLKRHNSGPTFKEFLHFIVHNNKIGKQFDEHWAPIYSFCTPCTINFTLIAKVETFQRDSEYIIRQAGLEPLLLGKLPKSKMRKISNQSAHNTGNLIQRYFSQIDRQTLDAVLDIYRLDFELFGYDLTKYYDIVQPPSTTTPPYSPELFTTNLSTVSQTATNTKSLTTITDQDHFNHLI
ncbi:carbohydrate sulfotransferase 11 [Eupeodes corollae]|uniref:carbohydrate sulfotransferase 11 n=1 Tax=Eupeodes corollae TaxID=290404 RepID=UPI002490897D|nr:carbohydrate sulfotransferase 11 [Eupeodes corollae]XP_055917633.1 carbohydrate sulfotransferase 11 [Eupeodes corollae]